MSKRKTLSPAQRSAQLAARKSRFLSQTSSDNALISAAGAQVYLRQDVTLNDLTIGDPAASLGIGGYVLTANSATN